MMRCRVQMEIGPCPAAAEVCPYKGCPENQGKLCDGQGWCHEGVCRCAVDRAGAACSQSLCDTDDDCPRQQKCAETHECVGEGDLATTRSSPLEFDSVRTPSRSRSAWHTLCAMCAVHAMRLQHGMCAACMLRKHRCCWPRQMAWDGTSFETLRLPRVLCMQSFADFQPLRAVRVGYMRSCVFFGDDNGDARPSISLGERSQPTGPHGELALYLPGEVATLGSPVRQLFNETECSDTLSGKRRMSLLLQIAPGITLLCCRPLHCAISAVRAARAIIAAEHERGSPHVHSLWTRHTS